jgi:hypothetical protein
VTLFDLETKSLKKARAVLIEALHTKLFDPDAEYIDPDDVKSLVSALSDAYFAIGCHTDKRLIDLNTPEWESDPRNWADEAD